jgi:hypothetical protein
MKCCVASGSKDSGNTKGIATHKPKHVTKILTIAAEAHIRLEAWLALSKRNYRHTPSMDEQVGRRHKWKELARLVHKDRTDNADAAPDLRLKNLPVSATNGEDSDGARDDSPLPGSCNVLLNKIYGYVHVHFMNSVF